MKQEKNCQINNDTRQKGFTQKFKRNENLNSGRWTANEHNKFLEAVLIHGNDWKYVQKIIKSRSSTQSRAHAMKFVLKISKKLKIIPDMSNKLSHISINRIVEEIIEKSCLKTKLYPNTGKLLNLIQGFSNVIVGRVTFPLGLKRKVIKVNSNNESRIVSRYDLNNTRGKFNRCPKKVFYIEKIVKEVRKHSVTISTADSIQSNRSFDKTFNTLCKLFEMNDFKNEKLVNYDDLIKHLVKEIPQNVYSSNKNPKLINFISINICNKNEENIIFEAGNNLPNSIVNTIESSEKNSEKKFDSPTFNSNFNYTISNLNQDALSSFEKVAQDSQINNKIFSDVMLDSFLKPAIINNSANKINEDSKFFLFDQKNVDNYEQEMFFDWN